MAEVQQSQEDLFRPLEELFGKPPGTGGQMVPATPAAPEKRRQVQRTSTQDFVFPFDPAKGLWRTVEKVLLTEIDENGQARTQEHVVTGVAYASDGRPIADLRDFRMSPQTGESFTGESMTRCPGCTMPVYIRETFPSDADPKVLVCADCKRRGV